MSCRDCGKKANRYGNKPVGGNLDALSANRVPVQEEIPGKGFKADFSNEELERAAAAGDPLMQFTAAKSKTYEELATRRQLEQRLIKSQSDAMLGEMTEAMKRVHVDELISVANADRLSLPGMTPAQAIVALQELLEREDFSFIENHYEGLTAAVKERYEELVSRRLPGPQKL